MWRARATSVPSPQKVQEKPRKSGDKLKGITFETRLIKGLVIIDRLGRKGGWSSEDFVCVTTKFTWSSVRLCNTLKIPPPPPLHNG